MSADVIQANYEELETIANRFQQRAELTIELYSQFQRSVAVLEEGAWEGKGVATFLAEMHNDIYPAMQRLARALEDARTVTLAIHEILWNAEKEAAAVFQGNSGPPLNGTSKTSGGGLWNKIGEWVHGGLDVLGFVPGFGEAADGINGLIYLAEGRHVEAAISFAAMIPIVGDVGKVGKYGVKAGREVLEEVGERAVREGTETLVERGAKEGAETVGERGAREAGESLRFGELQPNTTYVRNGHEYATDALGRTERVSGDLALGPAPRTAHQTEVGRMGTSGDEGGHLIGSRFGGTPEGVNLVPQNMNLNRGRWKVMENQWDSALQQGQKVNVDIRVIYPPGNSVRPGLFDVKYQIDSQTFQRTFRNRPGG